MEREVSEKLRKLASVSKGDAKLLWTEVRTKSESAENGRKTRDLRLGRRRSASLASLAFDDFLSFQQFGVSAFAQNRSRNRSDTIAFWDSFVTRPAPDPVHVLFLTVPGIAQWWSAGLWRRPARTGSHRISLGTGLDIAPADTLK
jgi:hypothetical protein